MAPRYYTRKEACQLLHVSATTFERQRKAGRLPFIQELRSPFRRKLYRADLIDRYLSGEQVKLGAHKPTPKHAGRHVPATA